MTTMPEQADLVVVGCGAGGLAAAVSHLEAAPGSRVVILERTSKERRGGNTSWTGAFFRLDREGRPSADFVERMHALSRGQSDPAIIEALAAQAQDTMAWLEDNGVEMTTRTTYFLTSKGPRLMPAGGGAAIVNHLAASAERLGGRIDYESAAHELILGEDGEVRGLRARAAGGSVVYETGSVILACGGFEGDGPMLVEHLGPRGADLDTITPGGRANQGDGIRMALAAGAEPAGQYDRFHGEPVDPRSRAGEALVMVYPYGILVDSEGRRFLDEGADTPDNTFEDVAYRIWRDAQQFAYVIADQKLIGHPEHSRALLTDRPPEQADTIEGLAARLDLDPGALRATVDAYNAAAVPGELVVDELDGVATSGLEPPKSNWARPLDRPPYVAWPITCAITFTFGGVATDTSGRVLRRDGTPVRGLFAVGEVAGLYYHSYPGATSVLRALVFGRLAGAAAAATTRTEGTKS